MFGTNHKFNIEVGKRIVKHHRAKWHTMSRTHIVGFVKTGPLSLDWILNKLPKLNYLNSAFGLQYEKGDIEIFAVKSKEI